MVTPEMILQVRYEISDVDPALPFLSDSEINYYLVKNNESVRRAALDCAKTIMLKLSMSAGRKTIDILSIDNSRSASSYREALMSFIKNPELNGSLGNLTPYAGGISNSDMQANNTSDVNYVKPPVVYTDITTLTF
jgi:hypothetical protein